MSLPTPAEVMAAYSQAALELSRELGITIPAIMLRERACTILYGQPAETEQKDAA